MIVSFLMLLSFVIPLLAAFFAGKFLASRATKMPGSLKITLSGVTGVIAPVGYLGILQVVDLAFREMRGDTSDYMGPMVLLIYGFPLFVITWLLCFVVAGYAVRPVK